MAAREAARRARRAGVDAIHALQPARPCALWRAVLIPRHGTTERWATDAGDAAAATGAPPEVRFGSAAAVCSLCPQRHSALSSTHCQRHSPLGSTHCLLAVRWPRVCSVERAAPSPLQAAARCALTAPSLSPTGAKGRQERQTAGWLRLARGPAERRSLRRGAAASAKARQGGTLVALGECRATAHSRLAGPWRVDLYLC